MREKTFKKAYLIDSQPLYLDGLEGIIKGLYSDITVEKISSLEEFFSNNIKNEHQSLIVLDFLSFGEWAKGYACTLVTINFIDVCAMV